MLRRCAHPVPLAFGSLPQDIRLRCPPQHSPCFDPLPGACYTIFDPSATIIYVGASVAVVTTVLAVLCAARCYLMYYAFCRVARPDAYPAAPRRHAPRRAEMVVSGGEAPRHDKSA